MWGNALLATFVSLILQIYGALWGLYLNRFDAGVMNLHPTSEISRLTWLLNWEGSYPMAAGSKAGSWLLSAKEKTEHSLVVPMFWSFLCAHMPAAETKPRSQLASTVFKSFWRTSIVFLLWFGDLLLLAVLTGDFHVACIWLHSKGELRLFCPFT